MEDCLQTVRVNLKTVAGTTVDLNATIQDTHPDGSDIGTVIAFHGIPGSHRDFSALLPRLQERGVRLIATCFPGFGYTPHDERLRSDSDEAVQFAEQIVDRVAPKGNLVFVGHSRGSEVALRMGNLNENRTKGVVLVNPIGLSAHRSVRPRWVCSFLAWLWTLGSAMRFILRPLLYLFFSKLMKMKIKDGDVAATTVKAVSAIDFPSQLRYIQQLRDSHVQVLMVYSGSDPFIEQSISDHLVEAFGSIKRLICSSVVPEDSTTDEYIEAVRSGERKVAVCFAKEGHQLQKTRAKFLADAIVAMLEMNQNPATMH